MLQLGQVVMTKGIADKVAEDVQFADAVINCVKRHANCDWGDLSEEDKKINDEAVKDGERILSAYNINGVKIWIITEWDRSYTTILFPEEY